MKSYKIVLDDKQTRYQSQVKVNTWYDTKYDTLILIQTILYSISILFRWCVASGFHHNIIWEWLSIVILGMTWKNALRFFFFNCSFWLIPYSWLWNFSSGSAWVREFFLHTFINITLSRSKIPDTDCNKVFLKFGRYELIFAWTNLRGKKKLIFAVLPFLTISFLFSQKFW